MMEVQTEFHWTTTQRGAPAIQIGSYLYRIQKHNHNGSIRFICTDERCNASVTLLENKIKFMRGIHHYEEHVLPFHIGEMVHEFQQEAVSYIRTPLPQIYDRIAKKFVYFSFKDFYSFYVLIFNNFVRRDTNMEQQQKCQCFNN